VQKEVTKTELKPTSEHSDIVDKEISGLENLSKNPSPAEKEVDEAKLKEIKREEEIAKAKQAMERKKKLAEKAAAKAAARAQKDAEKKLKVISLFLYFNHYLVYYLLSDTKKRGFFFF
jgi:Xaa-Pro aminopeptidase